MRHRDLVSAFFLSLMLLAAGFFAAAVRADDDGYSYARIVRLSVVDGDVQIVRGESSKWEPAVANMPIQQGFALGTNDGRAEIEFENGGVIWLDDHSVLQFTELALSSGGRITKVTLSQGTATIDANLAAADSFVVTTPHLEITPSKSKFRVDLFSIGGSVSVFRGQVSISTQAGNKEIVKGQTLAVNTSDSDQLAINHNPSKDDWDRWVDGRETYLINGADKSQKYATAPYSYGMADLSNYGAWNFYDGFGYGWQPFGIGAEWMPFSAGQWGFYGGLGWTWLSAEPWGWVPYHFGSWAFAGAHGWVWVPGENNLWNPAPVHWVSVGNRVGWTPLRTGAAGGAPPPVIIATRGLGKDGPNKILTPEQAGSHLESLASPPAPHGKTSAGGAGFVVPTAANLEALKSQGSVGARHLGTPNAVTLPKSIVRNGAPPALRSPTPPPMITESASASRPSFGGTPRGSSVSSPSSTSGSASASGSHSTSGASGGRPR
jgi:hypothetical protein